MQVCRSMAGVILLVLLSAAGVGAAELPALVTARTLYNAGDYGGAIDAAASVRHQPQAAAAAALIIARSHLERYRQTTETSELAAAREALSAVEAAVLAPRDRVDLLIGFGQSLYFDDMFGASAEVFETAMGQSALLESRDRLQLLDWWATALDRDAQSRATERRLRVFQRVIDRMEEELRDDPGNSAANYWLAVAARGSGDVERAWSAAVAGWVRATFAPVTQTRAREDLDRLVTEALIPERARLRAPQDAQQAQADMRLQWELLKQQWK